MHFLDRALIAYIVIVSLIFLVLISIPVECIYLTLCHVAVEVIVEFDGCIVVYFLTIFRVMNLDPGLE